MKILRLKISSTVTFLLCLFPFLFIGCEKNFLNNVLTQEEIARGLKSALEEGSKFALKTLGTQDGFLCDEAVKVLLPGDAANFINLASDIPFVSNLVKGIEDELILTINRAAEASIEGVIPVVLDAIKNITIQDANAILFSNNNFAATQYLQDKTYESLCTICMSVIEGALNKDIIGSISAQGAWEKFTTQYNTIVGMLPLIHFDPIETDLSRYTTQKTMDGVFVKIGDMEQNIRTDVNARVNDLLRKVFGQLD